MKQQVNPSTSSSGTVHAPWQLYAPNSPPPKTIYPDTGLKIAYSVKGQPDLS